MYSCINEISSREAAARAEGGRDGRIHVGPPAHRRGEKVGGRRKRHRWGSRNSGERNRTIMMRFIESIVVRDSSSQTQSTCIHSRHRGVGAIQSTFNFWMVLRVRVRRLRWSTVRRKELVSSCAPLFPRDTLDVLYLSIRPESTAAIFARFSLSASRSSYRNGRRSRPMLINLPVIFLQCGSLF